MIDKKQSGFDCCYCGNEIAYSETDPCEINLLINVDKTADKQHNQYFYCHLDCFEKKLAPTEPSYLSDLVKTIQQ